MLSNMIDDAAIDEDCNDTDNSCSTDGILVDTITSCLVASPSVEVLSLPHMF